jgi:hypothetical protein
MDGGADARRMSLGVTATSPSPTPPPPRASPRPKISRGCAVARKPTAKITPLRRYRSQTRQRRHVSSVGVRMNMEDGRLIARFQRLTTELLIEKRLGRRRPELTDELYQTWLEVDQRGLKETPEYRNVMKRADRHALWLAGLVMLIKPDAAPPLCSNETQPIATDKAA